MICINNMTKISCNFKEQSKIVRTGGIPFWGRGASRCQPKRPSTTPRPDSAEFTRRENAISGRGRGIETRRKGKGGENNAKLNNSTTELYFGAIFYK
jgi:hypothetical protein